MSLFIYPGASHSLYVIPFWRHSLREQVKFDIRANVVIFGG